MENASAKNTGNLTLVDPAQIHGTVGPMEPEHFGPRVLELSSSLQTTLDIDKQIGIFTKSLSHYLELDGLDYALPGQAASILWGAQATQRATYDLKIGRQELGSLRFYRELPFTVKETQTVENLLCALVYPLRNALRYKQAIEVASHDPLTGIRNRLSMEDSMHREIQLAHRQEAPLSLLVFDADRFKRFNDEHGHAFGDDVLKAIAQTASNTVRRSDLLFRYGGEEFVVLAAHTGNEGAQLLAERIRKNIAAIQTIRGRDIEITVSVGVATLLEDEEEDALFERADQALYQAKQNGRNQTVTA